MSFVVGGVPATEAVGLWPFYVDLVREALEYGRGELSWQDVLSRVSNGTMQVWLASNIEEEAGVLDVLAMAVTEIKVYPKKKVATIVLLAGRSMELWMDYLEVIEAWAVQEGCSWMRIEGRKGWERMLPKFGYERQFIVMGKPLGRLQ